MAEMTLERRPAQIKVKRLLDKLAQEPMTAPEIAQFLCLSLVTARTAYLPLLHARGQIHIKRWSRDAVAGLGPRLRPVFTAGPGEDAPRPPKSKSATHKRWYKKLKKDPVKYSRLLAKKMQYYHNKRFEPRPDVAAAWVFKVPT